MRSFIILLFLSISLTAGINEDLIIQPEREDWYFVAIDNIPLVGFAVQSVELDPRDSGFIDEALVNQIFSFESKEDIIHIQIKQWCGDVLFQFEISQTFIRSLDNDSQLKNKDFLVLRLKNLMEQTFGEQRVVEDVDDFGGN